MNDDPAELARRAASRKALEQTGRDEAPPIPEGEEERLHRDYEAEARAKALTGPPAKRFAAIRERAVRMLMRSDPYLADNGIDTVLRGLYGTGHVSSPVLGGPAIDDNELLEVIERLKASNWLVRQTLESQNKATRQNAEDEAFQSLPPERRLSLWRAAKREFES